MSFLSDICYFFGTFNPVHNGHLIVAQKAFEQFQFKQIVFIPAGLPPHRQEDPDMASAVHRLEMVFLAIANQPQFQVNSIELDREGPSYTIDTLNLLEPKEITRAKIPMILGADALENLASWHHADELIQRCCFLQAPRCQKAFIEKVNLDGQWVSLDTHLIEMPEVPISSTMIRQRLRLGQSLADCVPMPVVSYIQQHRLYQP